MAPGRKQIIEEEVTKMLQAGVIHASDSPWISPIVLVNVGLHTFLKMPYGLTNAPATFQCLMEKVLKGFIGFKCLLYLDDVIVFGNTFQETLDNLMAILCRFREYNIKLKANKCFLFQRKVNFLGHVVSENGIEYDPVKIAKMSDLQAPKTKADVRAILGLENYYRSFINVFSSIVAPLQ